MTIQSRHHETQEAVSRACAEIGGVAYALVTAPAGIFVGNQPLRYCLYGSDGSDFLKDNVTKPDSWLNTETQAEIAKCGFAVLCDAASDLKPLGDTSGSIQSLYWGRHDLLLNQGIETFFFLQKKALLEVDLRSLFWHANMISRTVISTHQRDSADLDQVDLEILRLTVQGLTAQEAADRLSQSPRTLEGRIKGIKSKVGAEKGASLAFKARLLMII